MRKIEVSGDFEIVDVIPRGFFVKIPKDNPDYDKHKDNEGKIILPIVHKEDDEESYFEEGDLIKVTIEYIGKKKEK